MRYFSSLQASELLGALTGRLPGRPPAQLRQAAEAAAEAFISDIGGALLWEEFNWPNGEEEAFVGSWPWMEARALVSLECGGLRVRRPQWRRVSGGVAVRAPEGSAGGALCRASTACWPAPGCGELPGAWFGRWRRAIEARVALDLSADERAASSARLVYENAVRDALYERDATACGGEPGFLGDCAAATAASMIF